MKLVASASERQAHERYGARIARAVSFRVPLPRHVYVHVPFCARRCVYCDFAIAVRRHVPVDEYVDAIERELALRFAGDERWVADTIYLGGGTPSRLGGEGVARLLNMLRKRVELEPRGELTLEANPDDVTVDAARAWRDAGVNRLSLGAQSFDEGVLRWMHRTHDSVAIAKAFDAARSAGIQDISLDLIFALPDEVERSWEDDLRAALALDPTHLSLYGLTTEPATPLGRWRDRGAITEAHDERYEREFPPPHARGGGVGSDHCEFPTSAGRAPPPRHNSSYWSGDA